MTKLKNVQRVILVLYCLGFAYCCVWVPWLVPFTEWASNFVGYDFLWDRGMQAAKPDLTVIGLRLAAISAIALGAFLASTISRPKPR